jgi:hypothetical protein
VVGKQSFCWLFWELAPNLNWEILSTILLTKYESEMNLGNNKQNNFAVEFISLNYSIMYLSFLYGRLETGPYYVIGYGGRASTQVSAQ